MTSKSKLNLYAQRMHIPTPVYTSVIEKLGFSSTVTVKGTQYQSKKIHGSKKSAEDDAAAAALEVLEGSYDGITSNFEGLRLERPEPQTPGAPFGAVKAVVRTTPSSNNVTLELDADLKEKIELLDNLCKAKALPAPEYTIVEHSGECRASITIGDHKEFVQAPHVYGSYQEAKLSVIELAIASLREGVVPTSPSKGVAPCGPAPPPLQPPSFFTGSPQPTAASLPLLRHQPIPSIPRGVLEEPPLPRESLHLTSTLPKESPHLTPTLPKGSPHLMPTLAGPSLPSVDQPSLPLEAAPSPSSGSPTTVPPAPQAANPNSKDLLNQYCQKNHMPFPQYNLEYSNNQVGYLASVTIGDKTYRSSVPHLKKKVAESEAAAQALVQLEGNSKPHASSTSNSTPKKGGVLDAAAQALVQRVEGDNAGGGGRVEREGPASQGRAVSSTPVPNSFKNILQEYTQKGKLANPHYETMQSEEGFKSTVSLTDRSGRFLSFTSDGQQAKKTSEQQAAQRACCELKLA